MRCAESPVMDALPKHTLLGRKVALTPMHPADIDERHVGWLNDPEVVRFSNQRFMTHDLDTCLTYLRGFDHSSHRYFSIRRRDNDERIGTITAYASVHHGTVDLGLMIGERSAWGLGYGLDAWDTLQQAALATRGVRKLTGGTLACNLGMIRIFERAGMQLEAARRAQEQVDDQPQDIVYYARFTAE